jgi:hypothetical protein
LPTWSLTSGISWEILVAIVTIPNARRAGRTLKATDHSSVRVITSVVGIREDTDKYYAMRIAATTHYRQRMSLCLFFLAWIIPYFIVSTANAVITLYPRLRERSIKSERLHYCA